MMVLSKYMFNGLNWGIMIVFEYCILWRIWIVFFKDDRINYTYQILTYSYDWLTFLWYSDIVKSNIRIVANININRQHALNMN